ncbi:hypothetical protein BGZ81_002724 [Podila clonocystis]|nr:hypothetical protein BGZ81_002724 [Podila clonocystis]
MPRRHPLEIPEILHAVGLHIPLWEEIHETEEYDCHPEDLLACCSVSKLWRAVLLPVLWRVYDRRCKSLWSVPEETLLKYCYHFQHIFGVAREEGPYHCPNVKTLKTFAPEDEIVKILRAIPPPTQLKTLIWGGGGYMHFPRSLNLSSGSDLCLVPWIHHLSLERWSVEDEFEFCYFLATRFPHLESITLVQFHAFDRFPSCAETFKPKSNEAAVLLETWCPEPHQPFYPLVPTVTKVKINFELSGDSRESNRLLEILKCFPNVEKVHLHGSWMTRPRAYKTQDFSHYCPKIRWLYIQLQDSELLWAEYKPRDKDVAHLVCSLGRQHLQTLFCNVMRLGEALTESVVAQHQTLEVFVYHQDFSTEKSSAADATTGARSTYGNLNRILAACSRLRQFSVTLLCHGSVEEGKGHPLFVEPWGCMDTLQELHLHDLHSLRISDTECVDERPAYDDRFIWCRRPKEARAVAMEDPVLELAMRMPKLCKLTVESTDNTNPKSQKAEKLASGRRANGRDSNMQSEHHPETFHPSPLRAAALRPEGTEFKVAGNDYGGARQKTQASEPIVDDKGIPLPLDKAVAEEIIAGRKEKEAVNHLNQELEHHVRIGLKDVAKESGVPTTVFSSMGGGRTASSTLVDFGGAGGRKAGGNNLPKEFEYREEDFVPLSQSNSSRHRSAPSGTKAPSQSIKATGAHKSSGSAPHYGLNSTFFKQPHTHKSNAVDSPELNLGTLFPEESVTKKSTYKPTFNTSRTAFKAPAHLANKPKIKHAPNQATPRHHEEAHTPEMNLGSLFQENEELSTRHYEQSTQALPKSLRVHAFAAPSQSQDSKILSNQQQLHAKDKTQFESLDDVDDGPAPQLHSISQQFFAKSPSHSHAPSTAHHSTAAPIHYSAMPPVHHAPPAHHSAPEHHLPTEHITSWHHAGAPVHTASTHAPAGASADPMHRAHAAPIYHAPSISQSLPPLHHEGPSHHTPTQIETIHMPHHAPAHAPVHAPTEHHTHIETIHAAYHPEEAPKKKKKALKGAKVPAKDVKLAALHPSGRTLPHAVAATPTSAPAPAREVSNHYPVVALGRSHDEPLKSKNNDLAPVKSQTDGAGLNAASFPSFVHTDASVPAHSRHAAESSHKAAAMYKGPLHAAVPYHTPPPELHPNVTHGRVHHVPTHTYKPNKRSKRSRKAAKKQEVARNLGVLGSISEALVGRRKNTVSTPVMRLNEIFGEAEGPITHDVPVHAQGAPHGAAHGANIVAPAAAVAAGLDGIRNLLGAIHMPAIISRHPSDNGHHDPKMTSDSSHDTHVTGHMQHKHTPSKAVTLKTPKINLSLFPEEDASYPRGDVYKHENPAHPKSIVDVTEIHYQLPGYVPAHIPVHSARVPAAVIQAPAVHAHATPVVNRTPLGHMHLDLHSHQAPNSSVSAQSAHGGGVLHNIHPQHLHSNAAALKKPKAKLNTFLEEQADYPRGDDKHHENKPSRPLHKPIEVHEVQFPAATSRKSRRQRKNSKAAALKKATVPVGAFPEEEAAYPRGDGKHHVNMPSQPMHKPIEVKEVQLDAAHLHSHHDLHPTMGESAATVVTHGLESIKAMLGGIHMPAMPNPEAQATLASLGAATAVHAATSHKEEHKSRGQGATLPLMYGTPVHAASTHSPTKSAHIEHHDPHVTHTATAAPLAHVSHQTPAVVPVYHAEPVVKVHSQDHMQHTQASTHAPVKAYYASAQHNVALGEHHRRAMDIHGITDDEENYFSADEFKSPDATSASKLKFGGDPAVLKHDAPVSVLPPANNTIKTSYVTQVGAPQHTSRSAAPLVATAAAIPIAGAIHHDERRNHEATTAQHGPTVLKHDAPVSRRDHKATTAQSHTGNTHAPSAPVAPHAHAQEHVAPGHSHHVAAPLMGAAAAGVKPDEVIVMESAMPKYKEAPRPDPAHHIPISAVAPVIPIKASSTQMPGLSHAAAPAAAVLHSAHNKPDVPVQTTRTIKPELQLHEKDVTKPTPLNASHPVIPVPTGVEYHSSTAAKVANAPRPIIPQEDIKGPIVKPIEAKVAKPVVETAKPLVAAQAVRHEKSTVTNTKPAPVPAVRPAVAAAVAAPVAAAAVHHHHHTSASVETPTVSSAQQIQQQYQQSHHTTAASSSNNRHVDIPIQGASSSSTQTTNSRQVDVPIQMQHTTTTSSSSNTVIPPPGYSGAIPAVNDGETVIWVKKVYTTQDYYDSEDEDAIDEFGHRKDRDVSRYLPGVHLGHNTNIVDHTIVGNTAQIQPQMQTSAQYHPQVQAHTAQALPQVQINSQHQIPMQPSYAPLQAQTASNAQSQMTNAQFQQHVDANNAQAQTLSPAQAQARRPSQAQVHPNNPETRRLSQATFQQHLKDYRRRSSVNNASSQNASNAGKNVSMDNNQQRQAAQ